MPDQPGSWFLNRGLFSDHFLKARLPQWKEWKVDEELANFRRELISLYESKKAILPKLNEAQTEKEFIEPVLDLLGYADSYIVQTPTKVGVKTNRPDYALFPDETTKDKAYQKLKDNDYTKCIGIADAKYWERELDLAKSSDRDTFTNQNPSFQIANYLTGTKQKWGILTNGRLWRLYCAESHLPLGNYYQIDLVKLLEEAAEDKLKYFYLFFRKAALLQIDGKSFLDHVLEGSNEYAVELEADIKERAYEVVELLCRGFATGFSHKQLTEAVLKDIYNNSLTLLYRLLFVFYAEARELLPLSASVSYRDNYSMRKIAHDIDEVIKKGQQLTPQSTIYYQRISSLFSLINTGDPDLGIPEYNGGLFNPEEHPFLEGQAIADAFLVPAIQQLAQVYDKELKRVVAVDYNTLSERHLGSIYEGLLEFKPHIASHDLVAIKEKGSTKYAPANKYPDKKVAYKKDELYLANDKGERKASGSYYTPEYIVNYIVENTLDPLVKEAQDKLKALKPEVDKAVTRRQKLKEQKQGLEPTDKYDHKITEERERLLEPYLSLKILDPAMGSGHFLARATDFLAEAIATDPSIESPTGLTEESELTYYRRRVVESCIYGVDLNPLAVELAKLTLWLGTMAKSKPLSFLNHHLRVGNSLIGAKVADLDEIPKAKKKKGRSIDLSRAPVQLGLSQEAFNKKLYVLLQSRALIAQLPTETLEDVHHKVEWERDFERNVERFRILADLWVSTYFDNNVRWDEYNTLAENLQSPQPEWAKLLNKECVKKALAMRGGRRFFHWELEFPEVFYDEQGNRKDNAGFNAVVGNPPYGAEADQAEKHYFSVQMDATTRDSAAYFLEASDKLSSKSYGMIVPKSISFYNEWQSIRSYILAKNFVHCVMDVGLAFPDVNYEQIVVVNLKNAKEIGKSHIHLAVPLKRPKLQKEIQSDGDVSFDLMRIAGVLIFRAISKGEEKIIRRINKISQPFSGIFDKVYRGLYIPDKEKEQLPSGTYKFINKVPDVQRYFIDKIWRIDIGARQGWLSEAQTILVPRIFLKVLRGDRLVAFYDKEGELLTTEKLVNVTLKPTSPYKYGFLLALINSPLISFYIQRILFSKTTETSRVMDEVYVKHFPIRRINFTTPEKKRKQLLEQAKKLYQEYLDSQNWDKLLAFIAQRLPQKADGTPDTEHEQSDVVHDLLAFLAEEMTRLNKEKQAKIKDFLAWLEKEILKGSVGDQKNKTKIKDFHESTFEDLLNILKKNKAVPDPCPSNTRDTIAAEFSTAMDVLTPLKARIKATDNLIDQIVYKLYGLTGDEIVIVEGKPAAVVE